MRLSLISLTVLLCAPFATAQEINTRFSESFTEDLEDEYGVREGDILTNLLEDKVRSALAKTNLTPARIDLLIEDAKPNHPTMKQLSDQPGLDYIRSVSIGGAKVSGSVFDATGEEVTTVTYRWYESDIRNVVAAGSWSDARKVFTRFSTKLAAATSAEISDSQSSDQDTPTPAATH